MQENGVEAYDGSLWFFANRIPTGKLNPDSAALHPGYNKKAKFTGRIEFKN
jgi:hypothetical protein